MTSDEQVLNLGQLIRKLEAARELLGEDAKVMVGSEYTYNSSINQQVANVTAAGCVWIKYWSR